MLSRYHLSYSNLHLSTKKKIYLVQAHNPPEIHLPRSAKFLIQQIRQDFHRATYNDQINGILYNSDCEDKVKSQLNAGSLPYYFELLTETKAIIDVFDGQVFVKEGFELKVLAIKAALNTYYYDAITGTLSLASSPLARRHKTAFNRQSLSEKIFGFRQHKWQSFSETMREKLFAD